jgi:hypothetical protein
MVVAMKKAHARTGSSSDARRTACELHAAHGRGNTLPSNNTVKVHAGHATAASGNSCAAAVGAKRFATPDRQSATLTTARATQ